MYCPNCGKKLTDGARFCGFCGEKMQEKSIKPKGSAYQVHEEKNRTASDKSGPEYGDSLGNAENMAQGSVLLDSSGTGQAEKERAQEKNVNLKVLTAAIIVGAVIIAAAAILFFMQYSPKNDVSQRMQSDEGAGDEYSGTQGVWSGTKDVHKEETKVLPDGLEYGELTDSGEFGSGLNWAYYKNNILVIGGNGDMPDFEALDGEADGSAPDVPWDKYKGIVHICIIERGVTSIGEMAFYNCEQLEAVKIPDTAAYIGKCAFEGCRNLIQVEIPDSVKGFGREAFCQCASLKSVSLPDSLTEISEAMFTACVSLEEVILPDTITDIGTSAFNGCKSLTYIDIPDSVVSIGDYAFQGTALENLELPSGLMTIGRCAFKAVPIKRVMIPSGVAELEIGQEAFISSGLENILIPDGVIKIGRDAFYGCDNLKEIYYSGSEESWESLYSWDLEGVTLHYDYSY